MGYRIQGKVSDCGQLGGRQNDPCSFKLTHWIAVSQPTSCEPMCEALSNSLDIKFWLCEWVPTSSNVTENETPMKAKKQSSEGTPFNDDDKRKRIMNYDLLVCTWNSRILNKDGASAKLAETLTECGADITAIQ